MYHFDTFLFIYSKAMLWTLVQSSSEYISAFSTLIIKKDGNNQIGNTFLERFGCMCKYAPYRFLSLTERMNIVCMHDLTHSIGLQTSLSNFLYHIQQSVTLRLPFIIFSINAAILFKICQNSQIYPICQVSFIGLAYLRGSRPLIQM